MWGTRCRHPKRYNILAIRYNRYSILLETRPARGLLVTVRLQLAGEKPTSSQFLGLHVFAQKYSRILNTLPESNRAPENGPGSKETSFPAINFQVLVSGRVWFFHIQWGHNPYTMGNWGEKKPTYRGADLVNVLDISEQNSRRLPFFT